MSDDLDPALVLPTMGEKPSKPYRTSRYTVREYSALPYAQRRAVDADCDARAGLVYTTHEHPSTHRYTVGSRPANATANGRKNASLGLAA
ncbi:MAG: hypothetical protein ACRYFZ_07290 [Janthinobacterium lividum]